jgi:hypothetical protein
MQTGPQGPQGAGGTNGTNGSNGKTILNGTTNPANSLGTDGDFYINTASYYLFGPKTAGTWGSGISLIVSGVQFEETDNKNAPNGYAGLDGNGKVAAAQLPGYVDDVLEVANYASLPATGETGKIYITIDTNNEYRWSGSTYVQIVASPGSTDTVPEGTTNKYFTAARVLTAALTGIGFSTATAVTATDTILQAFGKLQAQITGLFKIPAGGTTGQVLAKVDGVDGNMHWVDALTGGGGSGYVLPVATNSILGGVKQGANVFIHPNGTLDADIGNTLDRQTGSIPINNVVQYDNYGDSIADGYGVTGVSFPYVNQISGLLTEATLNRRSFGGTGSLGVATAANRYVPLGAGDHLATCLVGINDIGNHGVGVRTLSKIRTCIDAMIANYVLLDSLSVSASNPGVTQTGTWTTVDTTPYSGKAPYFTNAPLGLKSSIAGSTLSSTMHAGHGEIIIGTFTDDGQPANALGAFEVHVLDGQGNDTVAATFDPSNKNDGYVVSPGVVPPAQQGRMPAIIRIRGAAICTVKIVTLSNKETVIDYIGVVNNPALCSSVIVSLIPYVTQAILSQLPSGITLADIDTANQVLKDVVSGWAGFPVALIDPNELYDPNTMSDDGLHPNRLGQSVLYGLFLSRLFGGNKPFEDPTKDKVINGITFGQGTQTTADRNQNGVVIGRLANQANTTGSDNVIIGGLAGSTYSGGNVDKQVCIGRGAGAGNNRGGIFIGDGAGSSVNGGSYAQVVIGVNAQPPVPGNTNTIMIQSGEAKNLVLIDNNGFAIKSPDKAAVSGAGVASTHKIPFTYNGVAGFLLWSNV